MYEDKITFLLKSLWKAATNSNIRNFTEPRSKMIIALYLSNPQAYHGMNRLASTNIMKKSGSAARFYYTCANY